MHTSSWAAPRIQRLQFSDQLLQQRGGILKLESVGFGEGGDGLGERGDAELPGLPHQADAFGRGFEADAAAVVGGLAADEFGALEAGDNAAHRWRADLLGVRKFAEGFGAAENEDGESGELGGADAAFAVADTQAAQQVDGSGVELVGEFGYCRGQRSTGGVVCGRTRLEDVWNGRWIGWAFAAVLAWGVFGLDRGHGR